MRTLTLLPVLLLFLSSLAYAQLNTFSEGDVISAEKMNQNFESLVNGTQTRSTSVDCGANGTGSGINHAILEGYNDITIVGVCRENLNFGTAPLDEQSSGNPAPKYLRLVGSDASAKILDNSNYEQSVIRVDAGTLVVENLTVEGGIYTIAGNRNANVLLSGVIVQNFTERGVSINDSSYLGVDEGGLTITTNQTAPADTDQYGIRYVAGSSGWLHTVEVSNVRDGIAVYGGSMTYAYSFNIHDVETAIRASASSFLKYGEGNSVIENTSDKAIRVYTGTFTHWDGSLQISGLSNRALEADRAALEIVGLTVTGNPNTGEDLIAIHNSKFRIVDLDLSDSGENGLRVDGSEGQIRNATITNSQEHGLRLSAASVNLDGIIMIDGSGRDGMRIEHGSAVRGGWWDIDEPGRPEYTITVTNSGRNGIEVNNNSSLTLDNFLIDNSGRDGLRISGVSSVGGGGVNPEIPNQPDYNIKITNSNEDGIEIQQNSNLSVDSLWVENSGDVGVSLYGGSTFNGGWRGNTEFETLPDQLIKVINSGGDGIRVGSNSSLNVDTLLVSGSGDDGLDMESNASANIGYKSNNRNDHPEYMIIIERGEGNNNGNQGIVVNDSSVLSAINMLVTGHPSRGIEVVKNSNFNVWKEGNVRITGNGKGTDWGAPGLSLRQNSIGDVSSIEIINNASGVSLENGSILRGGWKDQNDTSLPDYTIVIDNNNHSALRVEKNSILDIQNVQITNNSKISQTNEWGTYYDDTIQIREGSTGNLNNSLITGNGGNVIDISNSAKMYIYGADINNNGLSDGSGNFSFRGITVQNHSHLDFRDSALTHDFENTALVIENYSIGHINHVDITNTEGRAFNAWELSDVNFNNGSIISSENNCIGVEKSKVNFNEITKLETGGICISRQSDVNFNNIQLVDVKSGNMFINDLSRVEVQNSEIKSKYGITLDTSYIGIRNSTVTSTYIEDDSSNGSNGIEANNRSQINFHWDNETSTTINAVAFPLKAREGSKIEIRSAIRLNSSLDWSRLQIEKGSYLELSGPNEMPVQTVSSVQFEPETEIHLSDRWNIENSDCHVQRDISGAPIYRSAVIYRNGSPTEAENIDGDCILAN